MGVKKYARRTVEFSQKITMGLGLLWLDTKHSRFRSLFPSFPSVEIYSRVSRSDTLHRGNLLAILLPIDLATGVRGAIGFCGDTQDILDA